MAVLRVREVSASRRLFYCKNTIKTIGTRTTGLFREVGHLSEVAVNAGLTVYNLFCLFFLPMFILFNLYIALLWLGVTFRVVKTTLYNYMFYIGFWVYREPYVLLKRELHHFVCQMTIILMVLSAHK